MLLAELSVRFLFSAGRSVRETAEVERVSAWLSELDTRMVRRRWHKSAGVTLVLEPA